MTTNVFISPVDTNTNGLMLNAANSILMAQPHTIQRSSFL